MYICMCARDQLFVRSAHPIIILVFISPLLHNSGNKHKYNHLLSVLNFASRVHILFYINFTVFLQTVRFDPVGNLLFQSGSRAGWKSYKLWLVDANITAGCIFHMVTSPVNMEICCCNSSSASSKCGDITLSTYMQVQTMVVWELEYQQKVGSIVYQLDTSSLRITHYSDVIMSVTAYQNAGILIICSTVCSGADEKNHQSSAPLAFVRGIRRHQGDNGEYVSHISAPLNMQCLTTRLPRRIKWYISYFFQICCYSIAYCQYPFNTLFANYCEFHR